MDRPPAPPGGRRVDLHAHTHFSDGALSPEALVALALERELAALAITDHDTVEALGPAREAARDAIELVPGIELSSALGGLELHLLGYFLDPAYEPLRERLVRFRAERMGRAMAIVERLRELGAPVDPDEVVAAAGPGVIGRPHLADALLKAGHAETLDDAFRRYLGRHGQAFIPRPAFHPEEAIALIHSAGGVSVSFNWRRTRKLSLARWSSRPSRNATVTSKPGQCPAPTFSASGLWPGFNASTRCSMMSSPATVTSASGAASRE